MEKKAPEHIVLTIFTPAYNRASLLPRLFDSIASQVAAGDPVEWLVIDDGSTDDTARVLQGFASERPDLVRHLRVENGGKHRAINRAAQLAWGDWVMIVDSDDRLMAQSVASVLDTIRQSASDNSIGVLRALKTFPELDRDHRFAVPRNPAHHVEWLAAQAPFDTAEVIRTRALRRHAFPDFPGERFMAEGWLWHHIDRTHLTFFINTAWIECFYQAEGLSASSRRIRASSPCGAMEVYAAMLASRLPLQLQIRASINWWRYWFHLTKQRPGFDMESHPSVLYVPIGFLFYLRDRMSAR